MSWLLDTCVLSELARPKPDARVVRWFAGVPDRALHISVLTLGEIRKGVEGLAFGNKKERLRLWLEHDLPAWFEDRVLAVDAHVADRWGRLVFEAGRPVPAIDSLLAATAIQHGLRLVTRNQQVFAFPGLVVVNPFLEGF
ncbi:PIN domain-containing protein [Desulfonatronum parangueonense]